MIQLSGIRKTYVADGRAVEVLRGVDLHIERGSFVAVTGPSGCGKTTLMNILGLLDVPDAGRYLWDGRPVESLDEDTLARWRNRRLGFVFQAFNLIPQLSARANVELPLLYAGLSAARRRQRALLALDAVGLADRAEHRPAQLSGGQQQRVAIARAVVHNPELIIADEPTGNLDAAAAAQVLALFERLVEMGKTLILVTHDAAVAARAQRRLHLAEGRVVEDEGGA